MDFYESLRFAPQHIMPNRIVKIPPIGLAPKAISKPATMMDIPGMLSMFICVPPVNSCGEGSSGAGICQAMLVCVFVTG